jgi:S-formylglutathione hydrolase FrmB
MMLRRPVVVVLCVALLALAAPAARGQDPSPVPARVEDTTFSTPLLPRPTTVRVLLPESYDPSGATRYPVLYLLHGGAGGFRDWTAGGPSGGDVRAATAGLDLIVVMPDGGRGGWYTDWFAPGLLGQPWWETWHIDHLIPWVDANYPTVADRSGRAIAGLSMGGFGAMSYAARHPDLFVAASSYSGAVNTNNPPFLASHVIDLISGLDGGLPGSLFGLRELEEVRWRGHNPWDLAENLRPLDLAVRTGNGSPGGAYGGSSHDLLEIAVHPMGVDLHQQLASLGIAHVWDDYGPGAHSWPYWNRDLRLDLPRFMAAFARHDPPPASVTYTSIEAGYEVFDWRVRVQRPVVEFSTLRDAGAGGFTLTGSGAFVVVTPAGYEPGAGYLVSVGPRSGCRFADAEGRLTIDVGLGRGNLVKQALVPLLNLPQPAGRAVVTIADGAGVCAA